MSLGHVNSHNAFFIKQLQPIKQNIENLENVKQKTLQFYNHNAVWVIESTRSL